MQVNRMLQPHPQYVDRCSHVGCVSLVLPLPISYRHRSTPPCVGAGSEGCFPYRETKSKKEVRLRHRPPTPAVVSSTVFSDGIFFPLISLPKLGEACSKWSGVLSSPQSCFMLTTILIPFKFSCSLHLSGVCWSCTMQFSV